MDDIVMCEQETDHTSMEYIVKRSLLSRGTMAIILKEPDSNETQFCCVQCPARYKDKGKMELHLFKHNKEYRYLCSICGTGLKRREHLERHILGHKEIRPHVCPECGKAFKRKEHLNIHQTIHSGEKTQVCPLCQRSFYRKDHLQKHMQTHISMSTEAGTMFSVNGEVLEFKQEVEDVDEPVADEDDVKRIDMEEINQEDSKAKFIGVKILPLVDSPALEEARPFQCLVCSKRFKRKFHLKLHMQAHLKKANTCSECGKGFAKEEQLVSHIATHRHEYYTSQGQENMSGTMEEDYIADDTGQLDESGGPHLIPIVEYTQEKRHECTICGRRFKRKQHLKAHGNVHVKLQPQVWCSVCGQGFFSNRQFENHFCLGNLSTAEQEEQAATSQEKKENHYPDEILDVQSTGVYTSVDEEQIPVPLRVFVCKYCDKPFKRKDHYKIHLHVHTGIKSFFCPDCGKGFYRKDHLQKHSFVHNKPNKTKKLPALLPLHMLPNMLANTLTKSPSNPSNNSVPNMRTDNDVKPEITIHAPSNSKLRVPLQIKVPYQMVMEMDNGEQRAVTIDPQSGHRTQEILA